MNEHFVNHKFRYLYTGSTILYETWINTTNVSHEENHL
eukprot:UN14661